MSDTPSLSPAARLGQLIEKWRLFAEETVLRNGDDRLRKGVWMVVADDLADLLPAVQALEQERLAFQDAARSVLASVTLMREGLPVVDMRPFDRLAKLLAESTQG